MITTDLKLTIHECWVVQPSGFCVTVFFCGCFSVTSNECDKNQTRCEHLCVMSPTGEKCLCREGWNISTATGKCEGRKHPHDRFVCSRSVKLVVIQADTFSRVLLRLMRECASFIPASETPDSTETDSNCTSPEHFRCDNKRCINMK